MSLVFISVLNTLPRLHTNSPTCSFKFHLSATLTTNTTCNPTQGINVHATFSTKSKEKISPFPQPNHVLLPVHNLPMWLQRRILDKMALPLPGPKERRHHL